MRQRVMGAVFVLSLLVAGQGAAISAGRPLVFVTIAPQAFLVERLGGEAVELHILASKGQDPHTFEATPRQALALARAQLYFTVGMPFEKRLVDKVLAADSWKLQVVDSTKGINRLVMSGHHHDDRRPVHDDAGGRSEPDPHVWMTPANLGIMAQNMAAALVTVMPEYRDVLRRNLKTLLDELGALDKRLTVSLAPHRGKTFYVFHPSLGYFAQAYGFTQEAVETGGKSPTPRRLAELVRQAGDEGVKVIFVQPQFDVKAATTVARGIGGVVAPIDPMAGDVTANLAAIATAIEKALQKQPLARGRGHQ